MPKPRNAAEAKIAAIPQVAKIRRMMGRSSKKQGFRA